MRARLALLALLSLACGREESAPLPDEPAPLGLLARATLDGPPLDTAALAGNVVALAFWSPG